MSIKATSLGMILRQEVAIGQEFLGERTSHAAGLENPTQVPGRSYLFSYDQNPADGEGLFEFDPFVTSPLGARPLIFVSWVKIRIGGVAWSVRITDGDESAGGPNIDDPLLDVELASGTGNASVRVMRDFPPKSKLRVITAAAAGAQGIIEVEFHPAVDSFSRPFN